MLSVQKTDTQASSTRKPYIFEKKLIKAVSRTDG